MSDTIPDFYAAWKEAWEFYLRPFLQLCQRPVFRGIDWSKPPVYLDTELGKITHDAEHGRQHLDRLIGVTRADGVAQDVLLHAETQAHHDPQMSFRMYRYHNRLIELRGRPVVSLVILADDDPNWRPGPYEYELWGCRSRFEYLSCKLLDFSEDQLLRSRNPIAKLILAQRIAHRTTSDSPERCRMKLQWIRQLIHQGFRRQDLHRLFTMLERMTPLTGELDIEFQHQLKHSEPTKTMPFVTTLERAAMEQGLSKGISQGQLLALRESIRDLLEERFGHTPPNIAARLEQESDASRLRSWNRRAATIESAAAFEGLIGRAEAIS